MLSSVRVAQAFSEANSLGTRLGWIVFAAVPFSLMVGLCSAQTLPPFVCNANSGVPPTLRAEGLTELTGEIVLNCSGGTPTPARTPVPQANLTLFLNTQIASRIPGSKSEVLLTIDEPTPAQAVLCVPGTANPGAPTAADSCPVMGTGGSATEFKSGNSNVIRGVWANNEVIFTGVPMDPPGASGQHTYRIAGLRANATLIGPVSGQVIGLVGVSGPQLNNPTQVLGFVQPGIATALRT